MELEFILLQGKVHKVYLRIVCQFIQSHTTPVYENFRQV